VKPQPWVHAASLGFEEATRFLADRSTQVVEMVKAKVAEIREGPIDQASRPPNDWSGILERFATLSWYDRELVDVDEHKLSTLTRAPTMDLHVLEGFLEEYEARTSHLKSLKQAATDGQEDPQYHLAQLFCPPAFQERNACYKCHGKFGVIRYRHHCRACGESYCHYDSRWKWEMPNHGFNIPVRVCRACCAVLSREARADRVAWKLVRTRDYLLGLLKPYFERRVDNHVDKAARIMEGAIYIAKVSPLSTTAAIAVETIDLLRRYGLVGVAGILLRQEFVKAVELLCKVSGVDEKWPMSIHEISAAMYYQLAHSRGKRGNEPDLEARLHERMKPLTKELLAEILFYAPLPLFFMYDQDPVDAQLLGSQQGWQLVYIAVKSEPEQPAFGLFAHKEKNVAALVIRGTHSIQDIVTDIRAKPVPFGEKPDVSVLGGKAKEDSQGRELGGDWGLGEEDLEGGKTKSIFESTYGEKESMAMCGIARAAEWLYCEVYHSLVALHAAGTQVVLLGHSLGAAVASMTAELLFDDIPTVKCFAFATPACATRPLAVQAQRHTVSVVLHDDVIPRITPASVRFLLQDLMADRKKFQEDFHEDMGAVVQRAQTIWAPRQRKLPIGRQAAQALRNLSFRRPSTQATSDHEDDQKNLEKNHFITCEEGQNNDQINDSPFAESDQSMVSKQCDRSNQSQSNERHKRKYNEEMNDSQASSANINAYEYDDDSKGGDEPLCVREEHFGSHKEVIVPESGLLIVLLDNESNPSYIETPQNSSRKDSMVSSENRKDSACCTVRTEREGTSADTAMVEGDDDDETLNDQAIFVDDMVLPEQFIPGHIIHIYSQRGVYKACHVPQTFPDLRQISMVGNMVEDHGSGRYFTALLEVRDVLNAEEEPPEWVSFNSTDSCQICDARFTWHSTSASKAQVYRDKHNCRKCGSLVCDPCSQQTKALPKIGLTSPTRVCDKCFYSGSV